MFHQKLGSLFQTTVYRPVLMSRRYSWFPKHAMSLCCKPPTSCSPLIYRHNWTEPTLIAYLYRKRRFIFHKALLISTHRYKPFNLSNSSISVINCSQVWLLLSSGSVYYRSWWGQALPWSVQSSVSDGDWQCTRHCQRDGSVSSFWLLCFFYLLIFYFALFACSFACFPPTLRMLLVECRSINQSKYRGFEPQWQKCPTPFLFQATKKR